MSEQDSTWEGTRGSGEGFHKNLASSPTQSLSEVKAQQGGKPGEASEVSQEKQNSGRRNKTDHPLFPEHCLMAEKVRPPPESKALPHDGLGQGSLELHQLPLPLHPPNTVALLAFVPKLRASLRDVPQHDRSLQLTPCDLASLKHHLLQGRPSQAPTTLFDLTLSCWHHRLLTG